MTKEPISSSQISAPRLFWINSYHSFTYFCCGNIKVLSKFEINRISWIFSSLLSIALLFVGSENSELQRILRQNSVLGLRICCLKSVAKRNRLQFQKRYQLQLTFSFPLLYFVGLMSKNSPAAANLQSHEFIRESFASPSAVKALRDAKFIIATEKSLTFLQTNRKVVR